MNRWHVWILLFLLVGLGVAARCFAISDRYLWFDESFSWGIIQFPVEELLHRVALDVHPPLYYLLLKWWTGVWGMSVVALRSLSVLWGGLSIVGMYLFMVEAVGIGSRVGEGVEKRGSGVRGLAVLTAGLVATSAFQVRYAWEVRMYAQGAALACLSHWTLFRALRSGARPGWWLAWCLISTSFAYTHYFAFFSLAAQALFVGIYLLWPVGKRLDRAKTLIAALLAGSLVALAYVPWVPAFLGQRAEVQDSFWAWPVDRWSVPATVYQMLVGGPDTDTFDRGLQHRAMAACAGLVVAGLVFLFFVGTAGERYLVVSFVLPLGLAVMLSTISGRSIYTNRYFLFAHLSLLASVAALIWRIRCSRLRTAVAVMALTANAAVCVNFMIRLDVPNRQGNRGVAELLASRCRADELVVVASSRVFFPLQYYAMGQFEPRLLSVPDRIEHFGGRPLVDRQNLITVEELWSGRSAQVWIVHTGGFGGLTVPVPADWVPAEVWVFPELYWWQGEIVVTRYVRPSLK
jgi:hypothetical protein